MWYTVPDPDPQGFASIEWQDPDPHQSDTLAPDLDPDPDQFADDEP